MVLGGVFLDLRVWLGLVGWGIRFFRGGFGCERDGLGFERSFFDFGRGAGFDRVKGKGK